MLKNNKKRVCRKCRNRHFQGFWKERAISPNFSIVTRATDHDIDITRKQARAVTDFANKHFLANDHFLPYIREVMIIFQDCSLINRVINSHLDSVGRGRIGQRLNLIYTGTNFST